MNQFCSSCGTKFDDSDLFCRACGQARAGISQSGAGLRVPSSSDSTTISSIAPEAIVQQPQVIPEVNARVSLASGAACPECFSTLYYRKYTLWHLLIAIFMFPFGLLFLLCPVQRCENGHSYGLGEWIINIIQGILTLIVILIIVVAMNWPKRPQVTQTSSQQSMATSEHNSEGSTDTSAANATSQASAPISSSQAETGASSPNALSSSPFADLTLADVLNHTSAITVGSVCDTNGGQNLAFTFKNDNTGGCAYWSRASTGQASDGTWLLLIPTTSLSGTDIFALLYAQTSSGREFIGIMPGDGKGDLKVSIENGQIVERYHGSVRRSSYSNGHVENKSTGKVSRFVREQCGEIVDSTTKLAWVLGPNKNMTWDEAKDWAESLDVCGHKWRMPDTAQLATLYQPQYTTGVGYYQNGTHYPAHINPIFAGMGSGSWGWASDTVGELEASAFNFNQGVATAYSKTNTTYSTRAFAVRNPN